MAGLMRREPRGEAADIFGRYGKLSGEWARMLPFRPMAFPFWWGAADMIHVEEYRDDGESALTAAEVDPAASEPARMSRTAGGCPAREDCLDVLRAHRRLAGSLDRGRGGGGGCPGR